jgi:hypothetical protein
MSGANETKKGVRYVVKWSPLDNTQSKDTPWKIVRVNDSAQIAALASFYKVHENYWYAYRELRQRISSSR